MFSNQIPPPHMPPRAAQTFWNLLRAPHAPPYTKFKSTTSRILFTKPTPHLDRSSAELLNGAKINLIRWRTCLHAPLDIPIHALPVSHACHAPKIVSSATCPNGVSPRHLVWPAARPVVHLNQICNAVSLLCTLNCSALDPDPWPSIFLFSVN